MDAWTKGIIAAHTEGKLHARNGIPSSMCRYKRDDMRLSYMQGYREGEQQPKTEDAPSA